MNQKNKYMVIDVKDYEELGEHHYQMKDFENAYYHFQTAFNMGSGKSAYFIGEMFHWGYGMKKHDGLAANWYKHAIDLGYLPAYERLGNLFELYPNEKINAYEWYEQGANAGDVHCQYKLGLRYHQGIGVEKDIEKACFWYKKSAKQQHIKSLYALANIYLKGDDVEKNPTKGYNYLFEACKLHDTWSSQYLLNAYEKKEFFPTDEQLMIIKNMNHKVNDLSLHAFKEAKEDKSKTLKVNREKCLQSLKIYDPSETEKELLVIASNPNRKVRRTEAFKDLIETLQKEIDDELYKDNYDLAIQKLLVYENFRPHIARLMIAVCFYLKDDHDSSIIFADQVKVSLLPQYQCNHYLYDLIEVYYEAGRLDRAHEFALAAQNGGNNEVEEWLDVIEKDLDLK